ncbi:MAG: hypothetical protein M0T74_02565 [Desulfitobacterium hafniense]|nr:hypothetical protein [Desulfitobacterium hafniense]
MRFKVVFQVAATYVGAVMGAGFASGQEIQQFFASFGKLGLTGIVVSASLFSFLGWIMLDLQNRWKVSSYPDFFRFLLGSKWGARTDSLISALLFIGMIAMLSGSGALFSEYFGLSKWLGIVLTGLVIAVALWFKGEGVLWINTVLIPLKFAFCLGIGFLAIFLGSSGDGEGVIILQNPLIKNWLFSAVLYVSFNLTLAMVVFASLGKEVQRPGARLGAILGGVALGVFALVIGGALLRFPEVIGMEIPMVAVAGKLGDWPAFLYVMVLWLAMLTAAIGDGFSLVSRLVDTKRLQYGSASLLLLGLVMPLAGIRFSNIVKIIYPIFGYLGLIFLPTLIYRWKKD